MLRHALAVGAVAAFLAVALGAFGAHALRDRLAPRALEIYQTAVTYHLVHALALVLTGVVARTAQRVLAVAAGCFTAGIVLFSGSLYLLAVTGVAAWGRVTPLGGTAFLAGWLLLAWASWPRPARS